MKKEVLARYNDFTLGHHGLLSPAKAPAGSWYGNNATVYATGLLGPRTGITSLATTPSGMDGCMGLEYLQNDPANASWSDGLWAVMYDGTASPWTLKLYYSLDGTDAWALAGTGGSLGSVTGSLPPHPATFTQGLNNFFTYVNVAGRLYHFDVRTPTVDPVQVTLPVQMANIVKYRDWLVGGDIESQSNRIYFSNLDTGGPDFDTWDTDSYIDIGDSFPITALLTTTNGLLVGKATGWWLVSGVLGSEAYVRQVSSGYGPAGYSSAKIRSDNTVAVLTPDGTPGIFNGYTTTLFPDFRLVGLGDHPVVVSSASARRTFFICDARDPVDYDDTVGIVMHVRNEQDETWERWTCDQTAEIVRGAPTYLGASRIPDREYRIGFATSDNTFGTLVYETAKPGVPSVSEAYDVGAFGDGVGQADFAATTPIEAEVWFPETIDPRGREIQIHSVRVNFKRWALETTGRHDWNIIRVKVRMLDCFEMGNEDSDWQEWREQEPDSSDHPVEEAIDFTFATARGTGFRIGLQMIGCAIREVSVTGLVEERV